MKKKIVRLVAVVVVLGFVLFLSFLIVDEYKDKSIYQSPSSIKLDNVKRPVLADITNFNFDYFKKTTIFVFFYKEKIAITFCKEILKLLP